MDAKGETQIMHGRYDCSYFGSVKLSLLQAACSPKGKELHTHPVVIIVRTHTHTEHMFFFFPLVLILYFPSRSYHDSHVPHGFDFVCEDKSDDPLSFSVRTSEAPGAPQM